MGIFDLLDQLVFRQGRLEVLDIGIAGSIEAIDGAFVYAFEQQKADFAFIQ